MATYPLTTLAPTIDATGISAPTFNDIYQSLVASFKAIYGEDIYISPDSQDGQWLGVLAKAIYDTNQSAVAVFQSFRPGFAQGAGLSSVVKINGIQRKVPTNSTCDLTITGTVGTVIPNGIAADTNGFQWALPASVTIPLSGSIVVTATCTEAGAIEAGVGTITKIQTPTYGWQSVTNATAAAAGEPVETDTELRTRQVYSTALPASPILTAILGGIANLDGVSKFAGYENPTGAVDANGLPEHSIAVVVQGGTAFDIATQINNRKTPGTDTYGTTSQVVTDIYGMSNTINFFRPTLAVIKVNITIAALAGYSSGFATSIKQAVADYINGLAIGVDVYTTRLYNPANLYGSTDSLTYDVTALTIARDAGPFGTANITIGFNELATCDVANITITVT